MARKTHTTDALAQYRDLLAAHGADIAAHTAPAVAEARANAARRLCADKSLRLPAKGDEGYAETDLNEMFAPDLGLNIMRLPVGAESEAAFRCGLPAVSSLLGVTVNDSFHPAAALERQLPHGVTVEAFSAASESEADIIRRYYGTVADSGDAPEVLNTALAQDGILIHVPEGVVLERPIQLVNILRDMTRPETGEPMPVMAVRRLLIVADRGARCTVLVCDHDDTGASPLSASTCIAEVVARADADVALYWLEETSGMSSRFSRTAVRQDAGSHVAIFSGSLRTGRTRNETVVSLDAPGASLAIDGMAIVDGRRVADNSAVVLHRAPRCHSEQRFKYLVGDNGRGAFEGLIRVDRDAVGTAASQSDRNILTSTGARMHTMPQLEIYCDDVKCSHGAATGQLDANALFYMRSRGIDLPEARSMLMNAFMADVVDSVSLAPLRDRLRHLVERRLAGEGDARCRSCPASCPSSEN